MDESGDITKRNICSFGLKPQDENLVVHRSQEEPRRNEPLEERTFEEEHFWGSRIKELSVCWSSRGSSVLTAKAKQLETS